MLEIKDYLSFKDFKIASLIPKRYIIGVFTLEKKWEFLFVKQGYYGLVPSHLATVYDSRKELEKYMILSARREYKIEDGYVYAWIEADLYGELKIKAYYDTINSINDPTYGELYYLINTSGDRTIISQAIY